VWCAGISLLCLGADIATKAWALSALPGHPISVAGSLVRLQLAINHGAAFGMAASFEPLLTVISLAGVIFLGLWAARASTLAGKLGAAVAAAGAAGNLLDRLARPPSVLHGGVVDWLHVSFYGPTFNLADVWLRGGLLVAAGAWLWHQRAGARGELGR
jgi:signal peptidase II